MFGMQAALLPDRGVVKVGGEDARRFLNGLATNDIGAVAPGAPRYAALLTPQGKIIGDFIAVDAADGRGILLDCPRAVSGALTDKLNFYKLRAKVSVENLSETVSVMAAWDSAGEVKVGISYPDPRLPVLGWRVMLPPRSANEAAVNLGARLVDAEIYDAHRIALGVPQGGADFAYGDAFPHEADLDQLGGVDFHKGCYVGQEVVSRVEHRNSARRRVVPIAYGGPAPNQGAAVMAGEKEAGTLGSTSNGRGLALMRLDRAADALAAGTPLICSGTPIELVKPDWASFDWPGESKAAE
jgi:folate-binding protein YgfZ